MVACHATFKRYQRLRTPNKKKYSDLKKFKFQILAEILSEDSAEEIATLSIPTNFAKLLVLEGFLKY